MPATESSPSLYDAAMIASGSKNGGATIDKIYVLASDNICFHVAGARLPVTPAEG